MNRDLTVGEPARVLRRFCLPLFGSIIFQQLYNGKLLLKVYHSKSYYL